MSDKNKTKLELNATLMDNAGANSISIRRILAHAGKDITDKVQTHKDIEQLLVAIDTLK